MERGEKDGGAGTGVAVNSLLGGAAVPGFEAAETAPSASANESPRVARHALRRESVISIIATLSLRKARRTLSDRAAAVNGP